MVLDMFGSFFRVLSGLGLFLVILLHPKQKLDQDADELDQCFPVKGFRVGLFHLLQIVLCVLQRG